MVKKMKNLTFYGVTATVLIAFSSMASAAHLADPEYDFGHDAIGNEQGGYSLDFSAKRAHSTPGGHVGINTVTATAYKDGDPNTKYFAYLDDWSNSKEAGIGVCKDVNNSAQCVPSSDDNVSAGEVLKLSFKDTEGIGKIEFHDAQHNIFEGKLDIAINGGGFVTYALNHILDLNANVDEILFRTDSLSGNEQFYVTAINTTPIPAAVWLFMSGLGSLGFFRKKKQGAITMAA
jgi:hypothetical protein